MPNTGRSYGRQPAAHRQRFYLDGQGHGVLEAGDKLTVTVNDEGDTVISVTGAEDAEVEEAEDGNGNNGNGEEEEEAKRRHFFSHRKMAVSTSSDGTVTIRPEGDNTLQIVGDPLSGAVTIVEIEPETMNVADGRY
jgi:hypothetical protein